MNERMKEKLKGIADLSKEQIGETEESVKINFVVPLLECFGHNRLDFEYKKKDIYIKKRLPRRSSRLIIETKNYSKNLDRELSQLERYCHEERPLLGIIANGIEILIFSYFWKFRPSFLDTLVYRIKRKDLKDDEVIQALDCILSRENLENDDAKNNLTLRENEIEKAESKARAVTKELNDNENSLQDTINELNSKLETIKSQIEDYKAKIKQISIEKKDRVSEIFQSIGLKPVLVRPAGPKPPPTTAGGKPPGEPEYISKYRAMLINPDSLPSKIRRYVEKEGEVTYKELKRICVQIFGCKNETSGSIGASVKVLKIDGHIKIEGKGDSKRVFPTT